MKIVINKQSEINVTPELLAEIFWEMDYDAQAEFFNHLGEITNAHDWTTQVQGILQSDYLDKLGRRRLEAFTMAGVTENEGD